MKIEAQVQSQHQMHLARVVANGRETTLPILVAASGFGSSVSGGELLFLALATCYCNDLYREAEKQGITLTYANVEVLGSFDGPGGPARNVSYSVELAGNADRDDLLALARHTDTVAEVQNTLRLGMAITLASVEIANDW